MRIHCLSSLRFELLNCFKVDKVTQETSSSILEEETKVEELELDVVKLEEKLSFKRVQVAQGFYH